MQDEHVNTVGAEQTMHVGAWIGLRAVRGCGGGSQLVCEGEGGDTEVTRTVFMLVSARMGENARALGRRRRFS